MLPNQPPAVFYDHLHDNSAPNLRHAITRLIQLRTRNGINCRSTVGARLGFAGVHVLPCGCCGVPHLHAPQPSAASAVPQHRRHKQRGVCADRASDSWRPPPWLSLTVQVKIVCAQRDVYAAEIDDKVRVGDSCAPGRRVPPTRRRLLVRPHLSVLADPA